MSFAALHERRGKNPGTSESPPVMMDNQSYVTALHQVVLGRAPDRARTLECPIPELWRRHRRAGRLAQQRRVSREDGSTEVHSDAQIAAAAEALMSHNRRCRRSEPVFRRARLSGGSVCPGWA